MEELPLEAAMQIDMALEHGAGSPSPPVSHGPDSCGGLGWHGGPPAWPGDGSREPMEGDGPVPALGGPEPEALAAETNKIVEHGQGG